MFLPGSVKVCLFGVEMKSLRQLVLVLVGFGFISQSFAVDTDSCSRRRNHANCRQSQVIQAVNLDDSMENRNYPIHPSDETTPGDVCTHADEIRYPEKIKYCKRDVETSLKRDIIAEYDEKFDYHIGSSPRTDFKIDHLIPLCLGGSNEIQNLWPQHKKVYAITDPLEPELCNKLSQGKILQKDAIELIIHAKHHLNEVQQILEQIRGL